jgi:hypothetical protein
VGQIWPMGNALLCAAQPGLVLAQWLLWPTGIAGPWPTQPVAGTACERAPEWSPHWRCPRCGVAAGGATGAEVERVVAHEQPRGSGYMPDKTVEVAHPNSLPMRRVEDVLVWQLLRQLRWRKRLWKSSYMAKEARAGLDAARAGGRRKIGCGVEPLTGAQNPWWWAARNPVV